MKKKVVTILLALCLTVSFTALPSQACAQGETVAENVGGGDVLFGMDIWGLGAAIGALGLAGAGALGLLTYKKSSSDTAPIYFPTTH